LIYVAQARELRLEDFAYRLGSPDNLATVTTAFASHVRSMKKLLSSHGIVAEPVHDDQKLFQKFLRSRIKILGSEEARERHSRVMEEAPMPDVWQDLHAASKFEESVFADLAYRAGDLGGKKGRVIRSIIDAVKDYGPPETDGEFRDP
jgi:hypothetical protein